MITIQQDSPESKGKITSGGPGHTTLAFSIEAAYLTKLFYDIKIFGKLTKPNPPIRPPEN